MVRVIWDAAGLASRTPSAQVACRGARASEAEIPGTVRAPTLGALSAAEPTVIAPEGELDVARLDEFRAELFDAAGGGAAAVVVDLSRVSFIDSSALGAVVELHNRLRRSGRRLAVVAPRGSAPAVLLDLGGLRDRLPVSETRGAALDR
jgi:anti-anti-sigma factor